jgi:ketosteroid isomerase-like protein
MKNLLALLLILAFITLVNSCSHEKANEINENAGVVKSMFDSFNRHDWKAMADHYIDSASFLDPSYGLEYVKQSRSQLIEKYGEMQNVFPDIHDEIVGTYPSGDKVIVEFISSGKAADGTSFKLPISCILTLKDARIVKDATYYDK